MTSYFSHTLLLIFSLIYSDLFKANSVIYTQKKEIKKNSTTLKKIKLKTVTPISDFSPKKYKIHCINKIFHFKFFIKSKIVIKIIYTVKK